MEVRFILDAVRQFGVEAGWEVARLAAAHRERGVIGFGIGGDEARGPALEFREVFAWAKQQGLHLAPHGGETMGPQTVWDALECGAERIGHGIGAIGDAALVRHLVERRIPLEICITSNLRTGAVASLGAHPLTAALRCGSGGDAEHGRPGDVRDDAGTRV